MTADVELLPLPEPWQCETRMCPKLYSDEQVADYARANIEADRAARGEVEALRAEVEAYKARADSYFKTAERQGKDAERLAEALRNLLNVSDKFTGDKDEDAATWCAVNDAARAALNPTAAQEKGDG